MLQAGNVLATKGIANEQSSTTNSGEGFLRFPSSSSGPFSATVSFLFIVLFMPIFDVLCDAFSLAHMMISKEPHFRKIKE
jgi:hypothetical protein